MVAAQACVAATYRATAGATAIESCLTCGAGKYSLQASTTCTDCVADKFKTTAGGAQESDCTACTAFAASPAGSTIGTKCTCNAGYWGEATATGTATCTVPSLYILSDWAYAV